MDDLKFGIGVTGIIVSISFVIGDIGGLIASLAFCSIPWAYEIKGRLNSPPMRLKTCVLCGKKFRINNRMTSGERKICNLCIDEIFKYSKTVPEMDRSTSE
jgi:hypothetical protein